MASRMCILFALVALALVGFSTQLEAGDEALDKNTVFVVSVDDWQNSRAAASESDMGRFMEEPSIVETFERLSAGITRMMNTNFEGDEESQEKFEMVWDLVQQLNAKMTGEFVLGFGYRMDPDMGMPMPNLVVDFHAPASFGEEHRKILDMLKQTLEAGGQMVIPASFAIGDIEFTGLEMMPGAGIYIGQFEDHHVVGTNKGSLQSYLASGDTAVGERFNSTTIYKSGESALRRGSTSVYFNLDALWNLTPMLDMMAGAGSWIDDELSEEEPVPSKILSALGLDSIAGVAVKYYYTEEGAGTDSIIAMQGRPGILGLIPEQNGDITFPPVISSDVASAFLMRMNFSKIFDIIVNIGSTIEGTDPEEMRAEMDASLEGMKMMTGIDVQELIGSLEGTFFAFSPAPDPDAPPFNPMAAMMGGGMGSDVGGNFGFKVKNRDPWDAAMKSLGGPEMMGPALKKEEFQGREIWSFDPLGDVPPEFAGDGPQIVPAWTFEDDWLIISMSKDDLQGMLRLADDDGGARLGSSGRTAKILAKVKATQGMGLGLQNTGANLTMAADIIRPVLGILPLMAPDLAQEEDLLFLFDPSNIPESELFGKYFGWTANRTSIVAEGLKSYSFSERVTETKAKGDSDAEAGL
ncbi:MAG: hypothetical protein AAEJ04_00875 [Planctomycetota bacterium]